MKLLKSKKKEDTAIAPGETGPIGVANPVVESRVVDHKKNIPPAGFEAYNIGRDGEHWGVWGVKILADGTAEFSKVMDRELYHAARMKVGERLMKYQLDLVK